MIVALAVVGYLLVGFLAMLVLAWRDEGVFESAEGVTLAVALFLVWPVVALYGVAFGAGWLATWIVDRVCK